MKKYIFLFAILSFLYSCSFPFEDEQPTTYKETITIDNFMYKAEGKFLTTYDISNPNSIEKIDEIKIVEAIRSMITFGNLIFIKTSFSITVYTIDTDGKPTEDQTTSIGFFMDEQNVCDPMIVDDNIAYIALPVVDDNDDFRCSRSSEINQVRVFDISDLSSPMAIDTIQLFDPVRLAYDNKLLFVADGTNGLKVFDTSTPSQLKETYHFDNRDVSNVIISDGQLITIGKFEIAQYDYSNSDDIYQVSKLEI